MKVSPSGHPTEAESLSARELEECFGSRQTALDNEKSSQPVSSRVLQVHSRPMARHWLLSGFTLPPKAISVSAARRRSKAAAIPEYRARRKGAEIFARRTLARLCFRRSGA